MLGKLPEKPPPQNPHAIVAPILSASSVQVHEEEPWAQHWLQLGADKDGNLAQHAALKKDLSINSDIIQEAYERLMIEIDKETEEIQQKGSNVIPQIDITELTSNNNQLPEHIIPSIRKHGVVIIRNVIPPEVALDYKDRVRKYIKKNIFNTKDNSLEGVMPEVYWSKPQIEARQHENMNIVYCALNRLFSAQEGTLVDWNKSLMYVDRIRMREPGMEMSLGPHIDCIGIGRWKDPTYRKNFTSIFTGNWESYNPWDATHRLVKVPTQEDYSFFRCFQGWLALSDISPGQSTLRVSPLVKLNTAYLMMRPFLKDVAESQFPGSLRYHITEYWHGPIIRNIVSIPPVRPGDCVFWHHELVHSVENENRGPSDSSVFYIPASPLAPLTAQYCATQRVAFQNGTKPGDFGVETGSYVGESKFEDHARESDLSELGKKLMGLAPYEGNEENECVKVCNTILGFN